MECGCMVDNDFDDDGCWEGSKPVEAYMTALTPVRCDECGRTIEPGEWYEHVYASGLFLPGFETGNSTCSACLGVIDAFVCPGGRVYGSLYADIEAALAELESKDTPWAALAKLEPRARERIFAMLEERMAEEDESDPACRVCGCTEERACPGGCWWVEPDLCSECVGKEGQGRG